MTKVTVLSWNVNGIRAVHRKKALDWFHEEQPDILCIQETKAQPDQIPKDLTDIEGYNVWFNSADRKGYSGVATYSKLPAHKVHKGLGFAEFDKEGRVLITEFEPFVLFNIYYPNGKASPERLDFKMRFYDAFLEVAEKYHQQGRQVVVCGDVNTAHKEIDLARPKENENSSGFLPKERAWIDKFLAHGYLDTLRLFNPDTGQYSWWDYKTRARERNVGWRIDYFFVNSEFREQVTNGFIRPDIEGSDHCPVGIELTV